MYRTVLDLMLWYCCHWYTCGVDCTGENWWLWIDASFTKPVWSLCDDWAEEGSICLV